MKSTGWRLLLTTAAAAGLALGAAACTKSAESKSITDEDRAELASKLARPATQKAPVEKAPAVVAPAEGARGAVEAPGTAAVTTTGAPATADDQPVKTVAKKDAVKAAMPKGGRTKAVEQKKAVEPAKPVPAGQGMAVNTKWYTLNVNVPSGVKAGSSGTVVVTLMPKPGWKLNQEFPTKLVVEAPAGVTVAKAKQKKGDATSFSEKKASFNVKFTAADVGSKSFTGKFKFAVCTDATCDPKTQKLAFTVSVL